MRTTIVIDPEVAQQIKAIMAQSRSSMKKVVNDLLRRALALSKSRQDRKPYRVKPFSSGKPAAVLPGRMNQLYDELEAGLALQQAGERK